MERLCSWPQPRPPVTPLESTGYLLVERGWPKVPAVEPGPPVTADALPPSPRRVQAIDDLFGLDTLCNVPPDAHPPRRARCACHRWAAAPVQERPSEAGPVDLVQAEAVK